MAIPPNIAEIIAAARAKRSATLPLTIPIITKVATAVAVAIAMTDKYGNAITLNTQQQAFVDLVVQRNSCCLIGAAGTGKTTTMKAAIYALEQLNIGTYQADGHKHLQVSGTPAIVGCAFTRNATNNLRRNMPANMQSNCLTLHALLEFAPVFYEDFDENGNAINKMMFEPTRNQYRPLPTSIKVIIIDEASMPSVELFQLVLNALAHEVQFIFLGDINQIPPVMGTAILGYATLAIPVIELKEVYRNAGPIIHFAHRILSGKPLPATNFADYEVPDVIRLQPWKKKLLSEDAVVLATKLVIRTIDAGLFDPYQDMILCPFNKAFGTIEINKYIANHLGIKRKAVVHEIITGYTTQYLAIGDRVFKDKEPGTITAIKVNVAYTGKSPQAPSMYMDRNGMINAPDDTKEAIRTISIDPTDIDALLDNYDMYENDDVKRQASHTVTIKLDSFGDDEDNRELTLTTAGELNELALGYALTIHKSQGSEWRRVIMLLHHSHNTMVARELLYTAVTRARLSLHVICEQDTFEKGIIRQRITGDTLAEKAEYFKGKATTIDMSRLRWK